MDFKKSLLLFCIIICILVSISGVVASDMNDTVIESDNNEDIIVSSDDSVIGEDFVSSCENDDSQLEVGFVGDEILNETNKEEIQQSIESEVLSKNQEITPVGYEFIYAKLEIVKKPKTFGEKQLVFKLTNKATGDPIPNVKLLVWPEGYDSFAIKTNDKGLATYNVPISYGSLGFNAGLYENDWTLSLSVNNMSIGSILNFKVSISGVPPVISASFPSGKYLKIKLTDSKYKKPLYDIKLTVKVYTGKKYKTVKLTTNYDGIAKYSLASLSVGKHKTVIKVTDKYVNSKTKTTYAKIAKPALKIYAPFKRNIYKTGTFKVTVKNKKMGNGMKGVKVIIKVYTGKKFKKFTVKTNSKGVATIKTKSFKKGKHKVVISIKGTSKYKSASAKSSLRIVKSKIKTKLVCSVLMYKNHYSDDGFLDAVIIYPKLYAKGKVLNKKLIVRTNGGTYSGYGSKGISIPVVWSESGDPIFVPGYGSTATVKFVEDNYYRGSSISMNF